MIVALSVLILAGCSAVSLPSTGSDRARGSPAGGDRSDGGIYAAVIRQLVTRDHTFGGEASPFRHVYVVDRPVPGAGNPSPGDGIADTRFPDDLKADIVRRLEDLPPVDFVADPETVRLGKQGMAGVRNQGAIITLGPIEEDDRGTRVGASLWCGGRCGLWVTYVLSLGTGGWEVTGTTGPVAVS